MTSKGDRIVRLEALLEKIRERSAQPRGMNGVAAGAVAQWAPEDTEIRISTTFEDPEAFAAEVAFTARVPAAEEEADDGGSATEEPFARMADELVEDGRISDLVTGGRLSDYDQIQDEADPYSANMLDEYEVSEDVVEIHVDAEDDSVRTSVEVSALEVPLADEAGPAEEAVLVAEAEQVADGGAIDEGLPAEEAVLAEERISVEESPASYRAMAPIEVPAVLQDGLPSGARLAGASGVVLSDPDEMIVNESDLVGAEERISVGVTVEVEETPSSSRRSIVEEEAPASEPPMTPPPASGKQVAAEYSFDSAAETLHPVGPIESPRPLARDIEPEAEEAIAELDAPRQIWKATSPPPQVEPETFGAWLDATMSL